jgi:hypothetical protein
MSRASSFGQVVGLLIVMATSATPCPAQTLEWNWESPLPQGNHVYGCWGTSGSDIFLVGDLGAIVHFNGHHWSKQPSGTWYTLHDVWGTDSSNVWAVGNAGTILHFDGVSWTPFPSGTAWSLYGVWGTAWNNIYAVGEAGAIIHFNGSAWTPVNHGLTTKDLHGIWGSSASDIFAVGGSTYGGGEVLHYTGGSWSSQTSMLPTYNPQLNQVWGTGAGTVYAVGGAILPTGMVTDGHIVRYEAGSWSSVESPPFYLAGLWGASSSSIVAVGNEGHIMSFDGGSWSTINPGLTSDFAFFAAWGTSASDIWAVGSRGLVYHFDGGSWSEVSSGFKDEIMGVWASGPKDIYVARWNLWDGDSYIDHFDGSSWSTVWDSSTYGSLKLEGIWGSSAGDIWAVGDFWTDVLHWDGDDWSLVNHTASSRDMNAVWGSGGSDVYLAGDGRIMRYSGSSWSTAFSGLYDFEAIWGSGPNDIYAAARTGEIFHSSGSAFQEIADAGNLLYGLRGCGVNDVYAVGRDGTLLHFTGGTWDQEPGISTDYDLEDVWCAGPGDAYVVTKSFGSVLHSEGGGWTDVFHSSLGLTALWGNASDDVYAVGRLGAIVRYGKPPLIFSDGFDSGDLSAWSGSTGGTTSTP